MNIYRQNMIFKELTSREVSFWTWSRIRLFNGEITIVTPGNKSAGSW